MDSKSYLGIIIILAFVFISKLINNSNKGTKNNSKTFTKITPDNFKLRPSLLNSNERLFFEKLKLAVGQIYDTYPQVQLGAIFQPIKQWHNRGELSRLNKRIDFLLVDKSTQTAKTGIELDGMSHSNPSSFSRDEFIDEIFSKFNIPLIRFNNGDYSVEEIKSKLTS